MFNPLTHARRPLIWWLPAVGIAAALKWHFSAADSYAMGWMLQPLSLSLRWITGWHFLRTAAGDWASADAGIVLVKACAGINFMTMSFVAWCLTLQPQLQLRSQTLRPPYTLVRPHFALLDLSLRLIAALLLAWLSALAVNSLRVIAVVAWQPTLQRWLATAAAHRLIGLVIYLTALTLQLLRGERRRLSRAAVAGALIYGVVMMLLPLLSGNAAANPAQYRAHAWAVLAVALPLAAAGMFGPLLCAARRARAMRRAACGVWCAGTVRGVTQPIWKTLSLLPSRSRK